MADPVVIEVDFSKAKSGGRTKVPEGEYVLRVKDVKRTNSKSSGNPMLLVDFTIAEGPYAGLPIQRHYVLTENALGFLRDLLLAMGIDANGKMKFDATKLKGRTVGAILSDGAPYKGQVKSEITQTFKVVNDPVEEPEMGGESTTAASSSDSEEDYEEFNLDDI